MQAIDCDEATRRITLRMDGEPLGEGAAVSLDAHLAACEACRSFRDRESKLSRRIRSALVAPAELSVLEGSILSRFQRDPGPAVIKPPRQWQPFALTASLAAAALVAGAFSVRLLLTNPTPVATMGERGAGSPEYPVTFVLEEQVDDVQVVPDDYGAPVRQDVQRVRRFTFPVNRSGAELQGDPGGGGAGLERINTRAVRLTSWPVR